MHPDIKKFWFKFYGREIISNEEGSYIRINELDGSYEIISLSMRYDCFKMFWRRSLGADIKDNEMVYAINKYYDRVFTEKDMLRVIKLKAFI